ncbi:maltase-glucoamylase-like isoform X1 [Rhopilema esculentum]|uniref:maltase-glucoamylase-like isoform X1 n=2 Tax=Rhopilema esculentum TaxID=499914 RepID=UPI0031D3D683
MDSILVLLFSVFLAFWFANAIDDNERFDCTPGIEPNEATCRGRGCVWKDSLSNTTGVPKCFFPTSYGYNATSRIMRTSFGKYVIRLQRIQTPQIYTDHSEKVFVVIHSFTSHLRIKIVTLPARYEVPVTLFEGMETEPINKDNEIYTVDMNRTPFGLIVNRTKTNRPLFDSSAGPLIFADQFLQMSTKLPSKYIYGFGEHEHESFLHDVNWKTYGMFSRDQYPKPNANLYGHHPFHMVMEEDGNAHGILLLNSNAMDVTLQPLPALTYRTIGGVLDFYMFFGPTPEDVVKQYTLAVGRPFMPPYWSLGFQLCRWGYNSLERVKNITQKMREYDIPQDVQYGDIDHMDRHVDFTFNKKKYAGLPDFVRAIKNDGLRYIIILDPAISANETKPYNAYDYGVQDDVFMKNEDGTTLFGKVWPYYPNVTIGIDYNWENQTKFFRAYAAFPDWTHANATKYWSKLVDEHRSVIRFDGLWVDMNEPANFITGRVQGCPNNTMEHPPYWPTLVAESKPKTLAEKSTCMSAKSYLGKKQYNSHSLYGLMQAKATFEALNTTQGTRPFVLTRSSYPSAGKYAGHWLGDNLSAWGQMHKSIIGMLEFGLFGIPYIGADICGFRDDTTEALCRRWTQLGAFYPFARNHNSFWAKPQDPPHFGAEFAGETRYILRIRYTLLPYLYTLFYDAHTTGATVVRPLMHEFTNEIETWAIDKQFLWGSALLIVPVLDQGATSVKAYFPKSRWFSYYNGEELHIRGARQFDMDAPENFIPLFVRGGFTIPTQEPANNTMFSRKNPFGLLIALNGDGDANGSLFWDDGESKDTIAAGKYLKVLVSFSQHHIKWEVVKNGYSVADNLHLSSIKVMGICGKGIEKLLVNEKVENGKATFNSTSQVLHIMNLKLQLTKPHSLKLEMNMKNVKCPYKIRKTFSKGKQISSSVSAVILTTLLCFLSTLF